MAVQTLLAALSPMVLEESVDEEANEEEVTMQSMQQYLLYTETKLKLQELNPSWRGHKDAWRLSHLHPDAFIIATSLQREGDFKITARPGRISIATSATETACSKVR